MTDVIGIALIGVGALLVWIGVHESGTSLAEFIGNFFDGLKKPTT